MALSRRHLSEIANCHPLGEIDDQFKLFTNDREGEYINRPNRFLLNARIDGKVRRAYCPNPGRLSEILLPESRLIFEKRSTGKTDYTAVAALHDGKCIPIHAGRTNSLVRAIMLGKLFPGMTDLRSEVTVEDSRFDFQLKNKKTLVTIEVKSCTLCYEGVAMFPDAPTARGLKHLKGLSRLSTKDGAAQGYLLFVVGHGDATVFVPNIHTDPALAEQMFNARDSVVYRAVSVQTTRSGFVSAVNWNVPISLHPCQLASKNCGVYLISIKMAKGTTLSIGSLGPIYFAPGYYVYVGSGKKNLRQRIGRQVKKTKKVRWHIDYLTTFSAESKAFPICSNLDLECSLAQQVRLIAARAVSGFGASDCRCDSHLFFFPKNPMENRAFVELLFSYRHRVALEDYLPPNTLII